MSDPTGIDEQRLAENEIYIKANPAQVLCHRCGGTGNELFWMHRACIECGGSGLLARSEDTDG